LADIKISFYFMVFDLFPISHIPEGVKKLNLCRHPGENRGPGNWQGFENTGFRLSPE
jgi:hypothetical protein